jgi:DNA-directed RNA polymerase specialized sigma subunit
MEILDLKKRFHEYPKEHQELIFHACSDLIKKKVEKYLNKYPTSHDYEERKNEIILILTGGGLSSSETRQGMLFRCFNNYDPDTGSSFEFYLKTSLAFDIPHADTDYKGYKENPKYMSRNSILQELLESKEVDETTDDETIAKKIDQKKKEHPFYNPSSVHEIVSHLNHSNTPENDDDLGDYDRLDQSNKSPIGSTPHPNPEHVLSVNEFIAALNCCIEMRLTLLEKIFFTKYYFCGLKLKEISAIMLKKRPQDSSYYVTKALKKIIECLSERGFSDWEDFDYA